MRALLWFLALFAAAVVIALAASHNTGYVLLVIPPWRIQLSLNLLAVVLILAGTLTFSSVRWLRKLLALPDAVARFRAHREQQKAAQALFAAHTLLWEGRYGKALRAAESAWEAGEMPGLAAMLAARAAHALRDSEKRELWLSRAREHGELGTAGDMLEAQMAIELRDFGRADSCLQALRQRGQRHIAALRLELKVAQGRQDWDSVLKLSRLLENRRALPPDQAILIRRAAHLAQLRALRDDGDALQRYWATVPAREQHDPLVVEQAVRGLLACGQPNPARHLLDGELNRHWDSTLAGLYGEAGQAEPRPALAQAEQWLPHHPEDAALLASLGRLCLQLELWGKAQNYLEASFSLSPQLATILALARLAERLGREDEARRRHAQALDLAALKA